MRKAEDILSDEVSKVSGILALAYSRPDVREKVLNIIIKIQKDAIESTLVEVSNVSSNEEVFHLNEIKVGLLKQINE